MKNTTSTLLLGAHMSIAGGIDKALTRGESINCTCIQLFTKSNRQWSARDIPDNEIVSYKNTLKNSSIRAVVAHASYLINIGSPDETLSKKSVIALIQELHRCEILGIPYLVLHPGAHLTSSPEACLDLIAHNINYIFSHNPGKTMLLLENTAGQGSTVAYTFEQLARIYNQINQKKRIGFCFDTCHAFVAGYDFRTPKTYHALWELFDKILGFDHLKAIHINDSKKGLGSHIDRHEHIGKGALGLEAFSLLFNDERLFDIPKILETPKEDELKEDSMNIETIKSLLTKKTKKMLHLD